MAQTLGIDFAWARPNPQAVRAAGYQFVMGYLSGGGSKDLTAAWIAAYRAAGLQVGLVWETTADRALSGAAGGAVDGARAQVEADAVGYPNGCVIFAAVDFAASTAQIDGPIRDYMLAFNGANRRPVGVYGSYYVVSRLVTPGSPPIAYGWQTMAWSRDSAGNDQLWQPGHLYQRLAHTYSIGGVAVSDWDENVLLNPLPLYGAAPSPQEVDLTPDEHDALMQLTGWLKPIERYVLDANGQQVIDPKTGQPQIYLTSLRQEVANLSNAVAALGQDPQAIADAVVQAVRALPAANAAQVADLVIAQLGQRINTPPAGA